MTFLRQWFNWKFLMALTVSANQSSDHTIFSYLINYLAISQLIRLWITTFFYKMVIIVTTSPLIILWIKEFFFELISCQHYYFLSSILNMVPRAMECFRRIPCINSRCSSSSNSQEFLILIVVVVLNNGCSSST